MSAKTPRTRKAKGRVYQQEIVEFLTECGFTLLKSTSMGVAGTDVQDPLEQLPWKYTECKRIESSPSLKRISELMQTKKHMHKGTWCLLSRQNDQPTLAVMPLNVLERLLCLYVHNKEEAA